MCICISNKTKMMLRIPYLKEKMFKLYINIEVTTFFSWIL